VVLYALRADGDAAAAFVTSRRVGGAVKRNRARRILRAAWRELAPLVKDSTEIVFVARDTIQGAKTQDLREEMEDLLRRAEALRQ
jgi:ribonuclease P protein component